jgi:tetratricopeptide (TPR) repeat protein
LLETLQHLFETGDLRLEPGGGWSTPYDQTTRDYRELPIPLSVRQAVLNRVDRLGSAARRLLEAASLSEDGFTLEEIAPATALSEWEGLEGLERTVRAQVLEHSGAGYRFAHDLTRSALSGSLSPERRRLVHLKLAANLERLEGPAARIALHLESAEKPTLAVPWRVRAAQAAARIYAQQEALAHYAAALPHAGLEEAFAIHEARIDLFNLLDDNAGREAELDALERVAQQLPDPRFAAAAALARAHLAVRRAQNAEALERVERVLAAPNLPSALRQQALFVSSEALRRLGRLDESEARLHQALPLEPDNLVLVGRIHSGYSVLAGMRGDWAQAQTHLEQAREAFRRAGQVQLEMEAIANLGVLSQQQGRFDQAVAFGSEALEKAVALGARRHQRIFHGNIAAGHSSAGRFAQALAHLRQAEALLAGVSDPVFEPFLVNNLAAVHYRLGQYGLALEGFEKALETARRHGGIEYRATRQADVGMVYLSLGDPRTAKAHLDEAQALLDSSGVEVARAALQTNLARLELLEGRPQQALARLEQVQTKTNEDGVYRGWILGLTHLAMGDYQGALEATQELQATPNETARLLAVRLTAQTGLGLPLEPTLREAVAHLADRKVEPLEKLELRRTLARAYQALGQARQAHRFRREAAKQFQEMAATLDSHPLVKESFLAMNRDLL